MKHSFFIIALLLSFTMNVTARNIYSDINLQIKSGYNVPDDRHTHKPRTPIRPPKVQQDGNRLILSDSCEYFLLELSPCNDNENIVYSEYIAPGVSVIVLPENLSGEYEIRLTKGDICFYGYINL